MEEKSIFFFFFVGAGHALEQEGVNNSICTVPRYRREGVCFSRNHEQEGVEGRAVQPHIPVLFPDLGPPPPPGDYPCLNQPINQPGVDCGIAA